MPIVATDSAVESKYMKAIFSFCTRFLDGQYANGGFLDSEAFACSCILSVQLAKQNVGQTELYTDTQGARLLDRLYLPFDAVHVVFDQFAYPAHLWTVSKMETYQRQTEPFVHIDLDAYLWAPLPERLRGVGIIAQSSEEDYPYYDDIYAYFLANAGYVPDFVRDHSRKYGPKIRALNAGIYGGTDLDSIQACNAAGLRTIHHPANETLFADLMRKHQGEGPYYDFNVLLEQFFAGVYAHQKQIDLRYVVSDQEAPYFTHLLGDSKRDPGNTARLKARVARDYPDHYRLAQGGLKG